MNTNARYIYLSLFAAFALLTLFAGCGTDDSLIPKASESSSNGRTYTISLAAGDSETVVYKTTKRGEIVLLEFFSDKIVLSALVTRDVYEEVFTLKPPTYFSSKGVDYVKNNNLLFWGREGNAESISIDGVVIAGFVLANGSQITADGATAIEVIAAAGRGKKLKLEKHYFGERSKKLFPTFSLAGVRDSLESPGPSASSSFIVSDADTKCWQVGPRKRVWLECSAGSYALNGPAIDYVAISMASGDPWLDSIGRPVGIGKDVLGFSVTSSLITAGLTKCDSP